MILAVDEEEKDRRRTSGQSHSGESAKSTESGDSRRTGKKRPASDVGNALRSAYQKTVNEDIPPEMLDLLGKLG